MAAVAGVGTGYILALLSTPGARVDRESPAAEPTVGQAGRRAGNEPDGQPEAPAAQEWSEPPGLASALTNGTRLAGADLNGARLTGADLRGLDLRGTDLRNADLRGADLSDAQLGDDADT